MSDIEAAGSWPIEVAIHRIITAENHHLAAGYRNQVAMAAMRRQRPERDAEAVRDAFDERWGHTIASQRQGPMAPLYYTGD
jgi:hypothetical protein